MSVSKFMKSGGWAAIAVALAASAIPAEASARPNDEPRNGMQVRGERVQQANAQREQQRTQQAERRTAQVQRQAEQRTAPAQRQTEQRTAQVQRQGNRDVWQAARASAQARQADRTVAQADRRSPWQGARQTAQRVEQATRQGERRGVAQGQQVERNRGYADRNRNRDYTARNGDGRRDNDRNWQDRRRDGDRNGNTWQNRNRDNDRNWQNGRRDNDWSNRSWDRRWRDNNRYDWQRYRNANRTVFRLGTYYAPYRNYSYSRFGVGSRLGSLFYGSSYWITNPWQYRLPEVWGPYRWVRYYDDVMLVDVYTGQVVDVIYNFFW